MRQVFHWIMLIIIFFNYFKINIRNTTQQISIAVKRLTCFGLHQFRATAMLLFYIQRDKIIVNKI
jgi:cytochrome b561